MEETMLRERVLRWAYRIMKRPHDFAIGPAGDPYMLRWYITPWSNYDRSKPAPRWSRWLPNIYLHHILHDDEDRALHDHPWASVSWLLKGRYYEMLFGPIPGIEICRAVLRLEGTITSRRATTAPRLVLERGAGKMGRTVSIPVISLFFTGPVVRGWGFHCPKGWVPWREFVSVSNRGSIGKGCE